MPPVNIDSVVEYLESLLGRKMTQKEKFQLLELIHFGKASNKKESQYYSSPPG